MNDAILAINAGSSSLKFAAYANDAALSMQARGEVSAIGATPHLHAQVAGSNETCEQTLAHVRNDSDALKAAIGWICETLEPVRFVAAGHRVVHGGDKYLQPVAVDGHVLRELESLDPLAPQHQPYNLGSIQVLHRQFPEALQVACFDTSFHAGWNDSARRIAIPRRFHEAGVRRYGFHGLSYEFLTQRVNALVPRAQRLILAHLGSGASICAVRDGRSIDATMGFSTLDGLPMATRSGSIDPGVVFHLHRAHGLSFDQIEHLLYYDSGLKGVSGISADMRELLASLATEAAQAVDLFVRHCVQSIGALVASLGGLDALVFSGGIGWHAPLVRERICAHLGYLGVRLGGTRIHADVERISAENALPVFAIKTDEEQVIARHARDVLLRRNMDDGA